MTTVARIAHVSHHGYGGYTRGQVGLVGYGVCLAVGAYYHAHGRFGECLAYFYGDYAGGCHSAAVVGCAGDGGGACGHGGHYAQRDVDELVTAWQTAGLLV